MKKHMREIKEALADELYVKLKEAKESLYFMRVNAKTGQMEKTADIKKTKKEIARILTEINFRKKEALVKAQQD